MILIQTGNEQLMFVSEKIGMEQFEKLNWNLWQVLWSLLRLKKEKRVIERIRYVFVGLQTLLASRTAPLIRGEICSLLGELPEGVRIFVYFFICLRRVTFVRSYKSNQKSFLKNFSVILSVCWTNPPTLAILRGRATSLVREKFSPDKGSCSAELEGFASMQSDREKFLADAFLFFIKLPVALQSVGQKSFYLVCQFQQAMFCIPYKYIECEAHSHRFGNWMQSCW